MKRLGVILLGALVMTASIGAAVNAPVADAASRGDKDAVRALLKDGADVNAPQGDGMTALHWAATRGDAEMASMLLVAGANPRAATRFGGYLPLHVAAERGFAPVVRSLVQGGADVNATTGRGTTALMRTYSSVWSSAWPLMMSGVRASSIRMESTSSTMA